MHNRITESSHRVIIRLQPSSYDDVFVWPESNMKSRSRQTSLPADSFLLSISSDSAANLRRSREMSQFLHSLVSLFDSLQNIKAPSSLFMLAATINFKIKKKTFIHPTPHPRTTPRTPI